MKSSLFVDVYWDGINKLLNGCENYILGDIATNTITEHVYTIPYESYKYIALLGAYPGSGWIIENERWVYPKFKQYNNNTLIAQGYADTLVNIKPRIYSKENGDVCKFSLTIYRPINDNLMQALPLKIVRFN